MTHDGVVTRVEFSYDMTEASSNRIFRLLRFRLLCWLGRGLFYFSGFSTHSTRRRLFSGTTIASLVLTFSFLAVCPQLACPRRCLVGQPSNPAEGIRPEEEARSAPERYHKDKRSDDAKHPRGSAVLEASALRHLVVAVVSAALPFWAANTKLKFHGWTFCRLPTRAHWCLADRGREPA